MKTLVRTSKRLNDLFAKLLDESGEKVDGVQDIFPDIHTHDDVLDCDASIRMSSREVADLLTDFNSFDDYNRRLTKVVSDMTLRSREYPNLKVFFVNATDEGTEDRYMLWFVSACEANVRTRMKVWNKKWLIKFARKFGEV